MIGRDFALETLQAVAGISEEEALVGLEDAFKVRVVDDQSEGLLYATALPMPSSVRPFTRKP